MRHRHVVLADRVDHHRPHVQHPAARERGEHDEHRELGMPERAREERAVEPRGEIVVIGVLDREPVSFSPRK